MSPPDWLIPVAALTATSTTHVASLPPPSPAPAPSPPVSVPTVTSRSQSSALVPLPKGIQTSLENFPRSSSTHDLPISSTRTFEKTDVSQTEANAVHISLNQDKWSEGNPVPQITTESAIIITPQAVPGELDSNLRPQSASIAATAPHVLLDITLASQTYRPMTFSVVTLSGSAILPSSSFVISDTPIALQAGGSSLIIGSKTFPIPTPSNLLTLGSNTITLISANAFGFDGQTAKPGSPVITVSGTAISINPKASNAVIHGVTTKLPPAASTVLVGGYTFTPGLASGYDIGGGSTLVAGGQAVTVSGTQFSLAPDGTSLEVAGISTLILSLTPLLASPTDKLLTFASSTYTPDPASQYIMGGQTLQPGSAITVSGTPIILAADATQAVVGSITETLAQSSRPLASMIMAGFGSQASGKNVSESGNKSVTVFTGSGSDKNVAQSLAMCVSGIVMVAVLLC